MILISTDRPNVIRRLQSVQKLAFHDKLYSVEELADDTEKLLEASPTISSASALSQLLVICRLCNGAKFDTSIEVPIAERAVKGDPTDTAILRFAEESLTDRVSHTGVEKLLRSHEKIFEIP